MCAGTGMHHGLGKAETQRFVNPKTWNGFKPHSAGLEAVGQFFVRAQTRTKPLGRQSLRQRLSKARNGYAIGARSRQSRTITLGRLTQPLKIRP